MAVGILEERHLTRAVAPGPGNLAVLFGSATGRDGIGGASVLASATFAEDDPAKRPSVQVGDPFAEKLLIEASLELIERGLVEGLQDLGAAGITCAVSETADRAGTGILVDLDAIPRREEGMAPFEVMISESQERMLAIVRPERLGAVVEVCTRWGLPAAVIGRVTDDGLITVISGGVDAGGAPATGSAVLAAIPAAALTSDAIVYQRLSRPPTHSRQAPAPGAPESASDRLPDSWHGPGRRAAGPAGEPEPGQPGVGHRPVRRDGGRRHRRRRRARGGHPAHRGDRKGARLRHGRGGGRGCLRPVPGGGPRRGRVRAQRRGRGRPSAGRHQLPQLR